VWDQPVYGLAASPSPLGVEWPRGFANETRLQAWTGYSRDPAVPTLLRPPFADNAMTVVQEC
jgi:hypothetical protein